MTRIAIVGAGMVAGMHLSAWGHAPDLRVVAICDRDEGRARAAAHRWGCAAFTDLGAMLDEAAFDVLLVCLPTHCHREAVEMAAARGRDVICEKPLAGTVADCDAAIAACRRAGVQLAVGHVVRFFHEYERARALLAAGAVGPVATARLARRGGFPPGAGGWHADMAKSGGVILDLMLHDIDFARWCLGEVERVTAHGLIDSGLEQADHALVVMRHRAGAITHLEGSWIWPGEFTTAFEFAGPGGVLWHRSDESRPLRIHHRDVGGTGPAAGAPRPARVVAPSPSPVRESPLLREMRHFCDVFAGRAAPRLTPEDARAAVRIARAAIASVRRGQPVTLDDFVEEQM